MSDYIKRADLAAALSNLLISPWAKRWMDDYAYTAGVQEALHFVLDMVNGEVPAEWKIPAADVVEVVRCKDCVWWNEDDSAGWGDLGNNVCACAYFSNEDGYTVYTEPNDYCSKGERKEDE